MARMRIITEALKQIKENDPNTALTLCGLRRLVNTGEIPTVKIGRKKLLNYDKLIEYLSIEATVDNETEFTGQIRKVG